MLYQTYYLRCWLTSATIRKWQLPIALQGGVLETHHDGHPMKHRSWSDVITKEMVALGNCEKPMPPKPYEGRSDLILGGLLTTAPAFLVVNHNRYLFRLSWYLARRCPAMIPDMQTRTSQCVSVIANRLSCFLQDGSRPWHRLYGTQPACKSWTATDLQVHVLRICKYDYNPKFGKLQDGREKWVESPNLHPIMRFSVV